MTCGFLYIEIRTGVKVKDKNIKRRIFMKKFIALALAAAAIIAVIIWKNRDDEDEDDE